MARSDAEHSRRAFVAESVSIASTTELALRHEDDLVVNAGAFVVQNPSATNAMFEQWTITARMLASVAGSLHADGGVA